MNNGVMFPKSFQGAITVKSVCEINRTLLGIASKLFHQLFSRHRVNNFRTDTFIELQESKNDTFSGSITSAFRSIHIERFAEKQFLQLNKLLWELILP
jgi:hypothetical protein